MTKIYSYGIDTSKWQASKVDFVKAKEQGVEFVILRVGYNKTKDKCFEQDYEFAKKAGLKVGAYFYTLSTSVSEAIEDATRVLGWLRNRHLDFPVAYDVEDLKQKKLSKETNSLMYNAFRNKIESSLVYDAMLYTGENFFNTYFNKAMIKDDVWIAKYATVEPNVNRRVSIWQFTSGYIDTTYYKGKLDRNYMLVEKMLGNESGSPIENISANPYPEPTRLLKYTLPYMRGNDVKWVQYELGFTGSDIDGIFGKNTKKAVLELQKKKQLKQDGIVGTATIYAIKYM